MRNPCMLSFLLCFIIANYRYKFHACLQTLENKDMFKTEERKGNKEFLKWNPKLESVTPPPPKGIGSAAASLAAGTLLYPSRASLQI